MSQIIIDSIEFSTGNDATIKTARTTDQGLTGFVVAYRHNSQAATKIALLNSQGTLSTYLCIPMLSVNPYANGVNSARTVWVAVNANKNLSTTGAGQSVYRNSAAGMMEMFLTKTIQGISNPYNALILGNVKFRNALIPSNVANSEVGNQLYATLTANVEMIQSKQKDATLAAEAIKTVYKQYQAALKSAVEAGKLSQSQIMIAEDIHPVAAFNQSMNAAHNPFCNFKAMAQQFGFTYAPSVNSVSGFLTTTTENAPEASELEVGRRALDKGSNPRFETSVMANATDGYGNTASMLVRVQDVAYQIKDGQTPRSQIFEELTENPTHMFVQGTLDTFVAEAGKQGATHGQALFGVTIDNYTLHTPPISAQLHANSLASMNFDSFEMGNFENSDFEAEIQPSTEKVEEISADSMI